MTDAARRARMMALAPADNAVLGRDLHHDAVALGHGADAERHLPLRRYTETGGVGFDVDDLHHATLYLASCARSISMPSPGPVGTVTMPFFCSIGSWASV